MGTFDRFSNVFYLKTRIDCYLQSCSPEMAELSTTIDPPARKSTASPSNGAPNHRSSFAENLRHSPRSQRHPSFTQAAVQELLSHPPASKTGDPRFVGRDWRQIKVGELVQKSDVRWAELDTGVEQATKVCYQPIRVIRRSADFCIGLD